jgi:diacylglycerol O-acyltransferase
MPELTASTQRLPFNVICRGPQNFRWAEIPLADIKAVKNACGATVNDVVLTIVTSAIRYYAELQGVRIRGRLLRIVVPVNVRGRGDAGDLGNRITFLPVTVPLDIRSPRKLLAAIRERMAFLKSAHVAELVGLAGSMLGTIPTMAQVVLGSIANELPLGFCNVICTNVPGPETPLYLLGHKMLRCYPYVPIGGDLGINCAVLTYDGTAYFGFTGNAHGAPNLGRLETFLTASFGELRKAARIDPQRRRRASARPKAAPTASPAPMPEPPAVPTAIRIPVVPVRATSPMPQEENELLAGVAV